MALRIGKGPAHFLPDSIPKKQSSYMKTKQHIQIFRFRRITDGTEQLPDFFF